MSTSGGSSGGGSGTVTSVTATDTSIVVSGTPTVAPTLATGTLDVIATNHPPAANWSNNSHKITALANGTAATDAAAFGQLASLAPNAAPWLARVTYAPGVLATYNLTSSLAAIDATNLTISFTVPASGNVVLETRIMCQLEATGVSSDFNTVLLAFVTHSTTTLVSGYQVGLTNQAISGPAGHSQLVIPYFVPVTGLTPGAALQYDLAGLYVGSATPQQAALYAGSGTTTALAGPASLIVWPA